MVFISNVFLQSVCLTGELITAVGRKSITYPNMPEGANQLGLHTFSLATGYIEPWNMNNINAVTFLLQMSYGLFYMVRNN